MACEMEGRHYAAFYDTLLIPDAVARAFCCERSSPSDSLKHDSLRKAFSTSLQSNAYLTFLTIWRKPPRPTSVTTTPLFATLSPRFGESVATTARHGVAIAVPLCAPAV